MTTHTSFSTSSGSQTFKRLYRIVGGALFSALLVANAHAAATALATEPFALSTKINALPNVMFVLDDSGSMKSDYLPDWAGPYQATISSVLTIVTPAHRFFNGAYNGVAYNPATRYRAPVMYDNTGALDTTTYPSQTGQSAATGGDGSATALLPNWKAVKVDGYGIQSAATASLEGNAYSYTTVPGEYCNSGQLRTCIASATPSGAYTFPAKLRWCTTSAISVDTTANAGTLCQASNIEDTPVNATNGVTPYTFPRMPRPHTATLTVSAPGTVSNITVDGLRIIPADATGLSDVSLAADIAAKINACTYGITGATPCTVVGYSAVSLNQVVTITAPAATSSTPVVTGGTTTPGAFSNGNVPGSSVLNVITPTVTSYFKGADRTDCAGATCTYAEEMTNYANWYAYYHTRMQMMKTASSIAFSAVDDKFRVGYYSINNGAGTQFLNPSAFNGAQKYEWYTKFLNAVPFGATPLRTGLSTIGRLYAGQYSATGSTLNTLPVNEPMQYSCQQNFTILSTDGYWNDTSDPVRIDGTTAIGQQDGDLKRPYYDGGTQTKTVSQTNKSEEQIGINTFLVESRTQQQQTSSKRLTQSVVTTTTYPFKEETTTLQTRSTPLTRDTYNLESRTYPLIASTKVLNESIYKLQSTTRPLESYTYNLVQTEIPLQERVFNITSVTTPLQEQVFNITSVTTPLQEQVFNITSVTTPLQEQVFNITSVTTPLQEKVFNITSGTKDLKSSTYMLQSSTRQLQQRNEYSTDGGDTWQNTGWVNVSSCTVRAFGPGWVRNTQCRYDTAVVVGNLGSCTSVAASVAPNYTEAQAVSCAYETTPLVATVGTCTTVAQSGSSPYLPSVSCAYAAPVTLTNQTSCTAVAESGSSPFAGPARTCTHEATAASTTDVATCTAATPANAATPKTTCTYTGAPVTLTNETTCTVVAQSGGNPYSGPARTCTHNGTAASTTSVATCNKVTPANAATPKIDCVYAGTVAAPVVTLSNETACTAVAQSGSNPYAGPARTCTHNGTAASTTSVGTCNTSTPANAATPKIGCVYAGTVAAPVVTLTNETACTAVAQSGSNPYAGPARTCTHNATPASTNNVASCTAVTPANASAPQYTCGFTGAAVVTSPATCTPSTNLTGPVNFTGPSVTCGYTAAVVATNLLTCTPVAASAVPPFTPYVGCGYGAGVVATGLNSCTVDPPEAGPIYTQGSTTACAYATTATTTSPVASCTTVAQSGTFAAPEVRCAYAATATTATVASCTDVPQSGSSPYAGPNVSCAYSGTPSATNLNAGTCNAYRDTVSPYAGPAVDCVYKATASQTTGLSTCVAHEDAGPAFTGPKTTCAYGAPTAWVNASATCDVVAPSAGPTNYAQAVECQYSTPPVEALVGTCTEVPQSTAPSYTQLVAKHCVPGSFPVVGAAVVSTVDNCSTDPTSGGSPIVVSTATTCTYQGAVAVNTATCTPVAESGASPYVTAKTCPISNTGWVAVEPSCTPAGTPPFNPDATGKVVECTTTDQIGTPAAPVPTAACTPGTDSGTKVQTNCTTLLSTGPTPVNPTTCTTVNPGVAPDYVKTICPITTSASTVMGCQAQTAAAGNNWQTVTCVDIAGTGTTNTLADVASYYYRTDLRTSALGNCTGAIVPPATTGNALCSAADDLLPLDPPGPISALNNVPTSTSDPNKTQHMVTFTLGLGASGYMKFDDKYKDAPPFDVATGSTSDFAAVRGFDPFLPANSVTADPGNGVCSWQSTGDCNWPFPAVTGDEQTTIDDLWHAGVNGHGAYFSATDPKTLSNSISGALKQIDAVGGASASPTISNPSLSPADSYIFSSRYTSSEWSGELFRKTLNPFTGAVPATSDWAVQGKLDAKTPASRNIWTFDSSVAVTKLKAFTSANFAANANFLTPHISTSPTGLTQFLCASIDTCLPATVQDNANALGATGANLVEFLRGVRTNEGAIDDNSKFYRQRQHVLGDLVNAQAVYVNQPLYSYADAGYSAFVAAQATRQAVVYAGANDGMLHAFAAKGSAATEALVEASAAASAAYSLNPTTANQTAAENAALAAATAVGADTIIGQELWAYIPTMVIPNLYKLADKNYKNKHRYYVDATPVVGDICVSDCGNAALAVWKTILVGGLARGGRGYYALDITDPTPTPTTPKALWEFTNDDLGFSYGNPQIVKLSNGTWVVLVTSGYNNIPNDDAATGDGKGRLFVINAATGALIRAISTGVGDTTSPSGLAKITAQVVNPSSDNTVEAVYGGDLLGNLWRFDVNNTIGGVGDANGSLDVANNGYDAQLLAILKDGAGIRQPITTKPEVGLIPKVNVKVVYVGTGRFLAADDASDTSQQSFYAIKDVRAANTTPATAIYDNPGAPRTGVRSTAGFIRQVQTEIDCPAGTAKNICDPDLVPKPKVRTSTTNPVDFALDSGWFFDLITTSERANTDPALALGLLAFNTNVPSLEACDVGGTSYQYFIDYLTGGAIKSPLSNNIVGKFLSNQLASGLSLVMTKSGKLLAISGLSGGGIDVSEPPLPAPASVTRRTSWRELIREQ